MRGMVASTDFCCCVLRKVWILRIALLNSANTCDEG